MRKAVKSLFIPTNPKKYIGTKKRKPGGEYGMIVARSNWERQFMKELDTNPNVLKWSSEELSIPYRHPLDGKIHKYFPDFLVQARMKDDTIAILVIEIKPAKEAKAKSKKIYDKVVRTINEAKFIAAQQFCDARGYKFHVITEDEMKFHV